MTLLNYQALIHILTGEAISPEPRSTLAGEGAGRIRAGRVGAAAARHALVQVMALGVIKNEAASTVAVIRPPCVDTGGGGGADVGCCTLVDVFTQLAVS